MKKGDFTGINGIPAQDMAMWESMGRIADRGKEILGSSDLSIVKFRNLMIKAAEDFNNGSSAIGTNKSVVAHTQLSSFEGIVPKSVDWRGLRDTV